MAAISNNCPKDAQKHGGDREQGRKFADGSSIFSMVDEDIDITGLEVVQETLPGLLAKQARITPNAIALDSYEGRWTYIQLQESVVHLQCALTAQGLKASTRIGMLLPLSARGVVSIMAIMALGGTVVPVDIHHPPARQSTMFREANVRIVVGEDSTLTRGHLNGEFSMINIGELEAAHPACHRHNCANSDPQLQRNGSENENDAPYQASPHDDAYIAFTSGSTGKPKGIVQSHAAIITISRALARSLDVQSSSRVAQIAPYVFDVAMMEFAISFGTGATLCTMRKQELIYPEPGELAGHLTKARISHITMSPTMLKSIVIGSIPTVKVLTVMGEALDRRAVHTWSSIHGMQFRQLWGCTEATILQSITPPIEAHHNPQNIGMPLEGACRLWVVDPENTSALRETGQSGELIVESRALASRYINQPEQTAHVFLHNVPWTHFGPDTRFYRTGDLARKEVDGSLTFLGRQDGQMSLHGERVELGEIDYHLSRLELPQGADCFAEFDASSQTIIGVACGRPGAEPLMDEALEPLSWTASIVSAELLSEKMQDLLEEGELAPNMVPRFWIPISQRPLTISHKTDRSKLRQMFAALQAQDREQYRVLAE
ncbi:hypothetical protein CKM354_000899100 [Cercospora kikuchii]|uniref:AMP-dependent synthetase/ligase domain-containing protein n=1 Tax=Cercospora kikuchii TaxID=84275 RepID=A0A9P3FFW2_9PEZI|nr:uncharacterized protein CKM354_000899100 [Cercospora kikuchii]GIZ45841.1 hypothetical protein CKM354_000899100 [Cercospora kikuchii]